MNYKTYIKEGQHLKTLLELNKLTNEEHITKRENLKHLLDRYIFYFLPYIHMAILHKGNPRT